MAPRAAAQMSHSCHSGSDINVLRLPMTWEEGLVRMDQIQWIKKLSKIKRIFVATGKQSVKSAPVCCVHFPWISTQHTPWNTLKHRGPYNEANSCTRQHDVQPTPVAQEAHLALTWQAFCIFVQYRYLVHCEMDVLCIQMQQKLCYSLFWCFLKNSSFNASQEESGEDDVSGGHCDHFMPRCDCFGRRKK